MIMKHVKENNTQILMILRGLPASGKSTFAKELVRKERNWKRINRDDLRLMLDNTQFDPSKEDFITTVQDQLILTALKDGFNVVIDNTHLKAKPINKLHKLAKELGNIKVIERPFNVSVEECIERNSKRDVKVPEKVIRDMAMSAGITKGHVMQPKEVYYEGSHVDVVEQDDKNEHVILVDLDGTFQKIGDRSPYDASKCDLVDIPNMPVINTVQAMFQMGYKIIFMSGREEKDRPPTERFIKKHLPLVPYELYMRPTGDSRKDTAVKHELFSNHIYGKYYVEYVLDDRDSVVSQWRAMGLTCFQVDYGEF